MVNHVSNVCGSVMDIHAMGEIVKEKGIAFMVDASQSAGVIPVDVEKDCIDILAAPGHKSLFGPTGTGFCYIAPGIEPNPLIYGGTGSLSEQVCQPDMLPDRYESETFKFSRNRRIESPGWSISWIVVMRVSGNGKWR